MSWLNLHLVIPQRDVRKLIWRLLSPTDRHLVRMAHDLSSWYRFGRFFLCGCVASGYLHVLKWARRRGAEFPAKDRLVAASRGQLEVLKWLCGHADIVCDIRGPVTNSAAEGGHVHVLEWLVKSEHIFVTERTYQLALVNGRLNVLQWLWGTDDRRPAYPFSSRDPCNAVAVRGYVDVMKWLISVGYHPSSETFDHALSGGSLEMIEFLDVYSAGALRSYVFPRALALYGDLVALKWARSNGYVIDETVMLGAIQGQRAEVVVWLKSIGLAEPSQIKREEAEQSQ